MRLINKVPATVLASAISMISSGLQAQTDSNSSDEIEQVIVVGTNLEGRTSKIGKIDTALMETPFSVSILTKDFFIATGVKTVQDALQYSAGVNGGTYGIDSRGDWATIRGTSPSQYVDGLQSLFGSYNNVRQVPYTLDRVEILKGPASALFGQSSIGGVINLNSKLPEEEFNAEIWGQVGNYDRRQIAADVTGAIDEQGKVLFRLVALSRDSGSQVDHVDDDVQVFAPSITWNISDDTSLTVLANIQENETGTTTQFVPWQGTVLPGQFGPLDSETFLGEPEWDRYEAEQQALTVMFNHQISDDWSLHATARRSESEVDYRSMWPIFTGSALNRVLADGRTIVRTAFAALNKADTTTFDLHTQYSFETGSASHTVAAGYDGQDSETDSDTFYGYGQGGTIDIYSPVYGSGIPTSYSIFDTPGSTLVQNGVYLQTQTSWNGFSVATGIRRDNSKNTLEGTGNAEKSSATTGRLGVLYSFDSGFAPYISYTESFTPIAGLSSNGDRFKPADGKQTEFGVKYQPEGQDLLITAAYYEIDESNRLVADPNNPTNRIQSGEVEVDGIELEMQASWDNLDLIASASTTNTGTVDKGVKQFKLAAVPEKQASAWANYRFDGQLQGLRLGLGVRHVGQSWDGADQQKVDSYTLFDGMVGYELEHWFVSLNARNLSDKEHLTSCLARGDCFFGERRTVTADVRYRF